MGMLLHLYGKMRMHYIRLLPGISKIKMSPYDLSKGRITLDIKTMKKVSVKFRL